MLAGFVGRESADFFEVATRFAVTATFMIVFIRTPPARKRWCEQNLLPERSPQCAASMRLILAQALFP